MCLLLLLIGDLGQEVSSKLFELMFTVDTIDGVSAKVKEDLDDVFPFSRCSDTSGLTRFLFSRFRLAISVLHLFTVSSRFSRFLCTLYKSLSFSFTHFLRHTISFFLLSISTLRGFICLLKASISVLFSSKSFKVLDSAFAIFCSRISIVLIALSFSSSKSFILA